MAEFEEAYVFTRVLVGNKLELAVAVDGSKVSMKALELAISFMKPERHDTLDLIHGECASSVAAGLGTFLHSPQLFFFAIFAIKKKNELFQMFQRRGCVSVRMAPSIC